MSKVDIAAMEDLTPGSVWHRDNGKASRVLFVTNQHFPEKILRTYPQQVIYADEHDNVISTPVEDFVAKRTFYNINPDLEQRLGNLLEDGAEEDFELGEGGDDVLSVEDDEEADVSADTMTETYLGAAPEEEHAITYQYRGTGALLHEVIDRSFLASVTRGYSQAPSESGTRVLNTLFIDAAPGVDQFSLTDVFSDNGVNASYDFTVATASGNLEVTWDEFVGVYPMVAHGQTSYQVMFYTYPLEEAINLPAAALDEVEQVVVVATQDVTAEAIAAAAEPTVAVPAATTV